MPCSADQPLLLVGVDAVRGVAEAAGAPDPDDRSPLEIDAELVEGWLVQFLRQEMTTRRGFERGVVGMSGGVDSSLTAVLAARALGGGNVLGLLLPSEVTSDTSRDHALEVAETAGIETRTIPVSEPVRASLEEHEPDASPLRRGNVTARQRMIVLYDQAKKLDALPVGTGNKSERLLGYFTWHADDAPPINPLGDLFKTQVWRLARHVGLPEEIVEKPATAELEPDQTDEEELGLARNALTLSLPRQFETVSQVTRKRATQVVYDLPEDWWETYRDRVEAVDAGAERVPALQAEPARRRRRATTSRPITARSCACSASPTCGHCWSCAS